MYGGTGVENGRACDATRMVGLTEVRELRMVVMPALAMEIVCCSIACGGVCVYACVYAIVRVCVYL
jgi:hypothetical protein